MSYSQQLEQRGLNERNGVEQLRRRRTVIGHGQDRDLGDRTIATLHATCTLVNRGQVRIHVTGISTATRNLLSSSRDLPAKAPKQRG